MNAGPAQNLGLRIPAQVVEKVEFFIFTTPALLEISYCSERATPKIHPPMQGFMVPASEDRRADDTCHFWSKGAHGFPALRSVPPQSSR